MQSETGLTLTRTIEFSRKALKIGGLSILGFLLFRFAFYSFIAYWKATHPPPPPPPTVGFGVLPAPNFTQEEQNEKPKQYFLETKDGKLPSFSDRAKVFLMPKKAVGLFDHETALNIASRYDFIFEPQIVDTRTYRWQKTSPILTTLELDLQEHVFTYQTDFMNRPDLLLNKQNLTRFDAVQQTKSFLSTAGLLSSDIATSSGKITYLKAVGIELIKAVTPSDADFIEVNLQRTPIDEIYENYTQKGQEGIVHAVIGSLKGLNSGILSMRYSHYPVDYDQVHTYPIRSVKSAWNILQSGEGFIANNQDTKQAVIREIKLGYYDDINGQPYLQPIYVFFGDNDFLGYVPAVDPKYLQSENLEF